MSEEKQPKQHRVTLEDDVSEVVSERNPKKGKAADSRFVNDCLRAYFISKGWMSEAREPKSNSESA
jgi:hypothetical protein